MTDQTHNTAAGKSPGTRPQFRVWLVQETPDGETNWTELCGLWPTKSGKGFKGALKAPLAATEGRIVVLPATAKSGKEG